MVTASAAGALAPSVAAGAMVPIAIPVVLGVGAVVTLSVVCYKKKKASDDLARASIEMMKVANCAMLFSQLRHTFTHCAEEAGKKNVRLMVMDEMYDIESAETRLFVKHLTDLVKNPKHANKGSMCQFIAARGKDAEKYAPPFISYKRTGNNEFRFIRQFLMRWQ